MIKPNYGRFLSILSITLFAILLFSFVPASGSSRSYTISGRVTDRDGRPVSGVALQVCDLQRGPVLLIPGGDGTDALLEDVDGLANLYEWMQTDGYVAGCNLFWAEGISAFNTRAQNRTAVQQNLRVIYDQFLAANPAWRGQVDIIGHSFGGLIARFYLESATYAADQNYGAHGIQVDNLITLGTPHGGTLVPQEMYPGVMFIAGEHIFAPEDFMEFLAVAQIAAPAMDLYNFSHSQPAAGRYHLLGGDFLLQQNVPPAVRLAYVPFAAYPGDIAVSLRSAGHLGLNPLLRESYPWVCLYFNEDMHGYSESFELGGLNSYVRPSTTYETIIREILGTRDQGCPAQAARIAAGEGQEMNIPFVPPQPPLNEPLAAGGSTFQAKTDQEGRYTIAGLAPGRYTVIPQQAGKTFVPGAQSVALPPDAPGVNFTLQSGGPPLSEIIFVPLVLDGEQGR
jgi:pimeloyl-ACP methyl ester carboxylesterase